MGWRIVVGGFLIGLLAAFLYGFAIHSGVSVELSEDSAEGLGAAFSSLVIIYLVYSYG
jgi:hypothetical protein